MAGVGISKHTETLTGLTASRMSQLMNRTLHWKILAESGIKIDKMNETELNYISNGIPNEKYGSDHLPLICEFLIH